jgi:hypothetical protein
MPIPLVLVTELTGQSRLLVPVDKGGDGESETRRVEEKDGLTQHQALPHDGEAHSQIHRVADISVQPTDDKLFRRGKRSRRPEALEDEPSKGVEERNRPNDNESSANDSRWKPLSEGLLSLPTGEEPRHETGNDPGCDDEEKQTAGSCARFSHLTTGWHTGVTMSAR